MMWSIDKNVQDARKLAGWTDFHRACGKRSLYFDHIEREGRAGYKATAFTVRDGRTGLVFEHVADGRGKTVLDAITDAYERAQDRFPVPEAREFIEVMRRPPAQPVPAADPIEQLFAEPVDDFDALFG